MENIFLDLTIIIAIAAIFSMIFKILKQPEILAYILTGILIGSVHFFKIESQPFLLALSQIGVTLLLFMVGLEIRVSELLSLGKPLILASLAQVVLSFGGAFLLSLILGFNTVSALYIATALTFSSTIIVVKLLSDKMDLHALYAKFSLGILIFQDVVAISFLMLLSGGGKAFSGFDPFTNFLIILIKGVLLLDLVVFLSKYVFPKLIEKIAKSSETLFLASLAWVFGLAALVSSKLVGFSIEIGGFLGGIALANSIANYQIIAKAKILRDFFIVIFFVLLGIQMSFGNIGKVLMPAIFLSAFVLILKPFIVMTILGILGYRKRTSFLTGISLSQVSEFSLIIVFLGNKVGHLTSEVTSLITLVSLITFFASSYIIINSNILYRTLSHRLGFFERKNYKSADFEESSESLDSLKDHVVVVGGDQMGESIMEALEHLKKDIVVVDFDPEIVKKLKEKNVHRLFGDIADLDIQKKAGVDNAMLVISTIPDLEDNLILLSELKQENRRAKIVMMAFDPKEAVVLYEKGADYVVLPHLAGGRQIAKLLSEDGLSKLEHLREKDKKYLS